MTGVLSEKLLADAERLYRSGCTKESSAPAKREETFCGRSSRKAHVRGVRGARFHEAAVSGGSAAPAVALG